MVNVNKDFMDGFVVAFALIDITAVPNSGAAERSKAKVFKTALKTFEAADKNLIDTDELRKELRNRYNIKFKEVES